MSDPDDAAERGVGLAEAFAAAADATPDSVALMAAGRSATYKELDVGISSLAEAIRRRVEPGRPVALLVGSGWDGLRGVFAAARAGAVAVPLNSRLTARELRLVLEDVGPALVIAAPGPVCASLDAALAEMSEAARPAVLDVDAAESTGFEHVARTVSGSDLAAIFYTTGTTGAPKGVMHTHGALLDSFHRMQELEDAFFSGSPLERVTKAAKLVWRYGPRLRHGLGSQVWLTPLPWHSVAGFRFALHALLAGHQLVLMEPFDPTGMLQLVQRHRANVLAVAPTMLEVALAARGARTYDTSSLFVVGLGGAPTSPDLVRRARAALGCAVIVGYGATETGGGVLVTRIEDGERDMAETVGRPFPGAEVRVVDERRRPVAAGEMGELACRSSGLMSGYHGQTAATADAVDPEGWYYTGDLAVMDERGYVRIVGRKRDLIIRGGQNVTPAEVEAALREHRDVTDAAVVGVPDRMAGESIWAFVVSERAAPEPQELRRHCAERLDPGKVPDQVRIVAALPVAESGEVRKAALRELAERELSGPAQREDQISRGGAGSG